MIKTASRIAIFATILLSTISLKNCEKQEIEDGCFEVMTFDGLEIHEIAILPDNPGPADQIEIIEQLCGNESEAIVQIKGNQINYKRYLNSLMMMPCVPITDMVTIGPLEPGPYELVRTIIDKNHQITDSVFLKDTIPLLISN
jgi:hypothetical protein